MGKLDYIDRGYAKEKISKRQQATIDMIPALEQFCEDAGLSWNDLDALVQTYRCELNARVITQA